MWPAQVVTVEPAAVRGAADVHALRVRREERRPARLRRSGSSQSTSSLKRKKLGSGGPTSSIAARRTSMQAPITHSTSRSDAWSKPAP